MYRRQKGCTQPLTLRYTHIEPCTWTAMSQSIPICHIKGALTKIVMLQNSPFWPLVHQGTSCHNWICHPQSQQEIGPTYSSWGAAWLSLTLASYTTAIFLWDAEHLPQLACAADRAPLATGLSIHGWHHTKPLTSMNLSTFRKRSTIHCSLACPEQHQCCACKKRKQESAQFSTSLAEEGVRCWPETLHALLCDKSLCEVGQVI